MAMVSGIDSVAASVSAWLICGRALHMPGSVVVAPVSFHSSLEAQHHHNDNALGSSTISRPSWLLISARCTGLV